MGTVATNRWLYQFNEAIEGVSSLEQKYQLQQTFLIKPLAKYFPTYTLREIHHSLLRAGLFTPDQAMNKNLLALMKQKCWRKVQNEYLSLKKDWHGAEAKIFLFPVEERNEFINQKLGNKMGLGFSDKIFLFVSPTITDISLKALLTHEYNHVCRLQQLNKKESELTLLDSLIIEGLGEYAVKERHGEKALAPWTKQLSKRELHFLWDRYYQRYLPLKGKEHHHALLYGDESRGLPNWSGYSIGYELVTSAVKNIGEIPMHKLLKKNGEELLQKSSFV